MTLLELAKKEGKAKVAIAARVDGVVVDLARPAPTEAKPSNGSFRPIPDGVEILRHSTAHVMAAAVKELFPEALITIGPSIENGFYYDFDVDIPFTPEDLVRIEERMREIVKADMPFVREEVTKEKARALFPGEPYKEELLDDIPDETVSLYRTGDFLDLCRGPHVPAIREAGRLQPDEHRRARTGAAIRRTGCSPGSTGSPSRRRRSSTSTCGSSRRSRSATTARSAGSSTCSA